MGSYGGEWRAGGAHGVGILDHPSPLVLGVSVLVLLGPVAVSSLLRFSHGLPGAMILVVILQIEISVMLRRFPPCLRDGVVGLNIGEFGGVWCLARLVHDAGSEVRSFGGSREVAGPVGGWVRLFGEYGVGGVWDREPFGVGIRGFILFSPGQSICKSLIRGWGACRGGKASPWLGSSPLDKMIFPHLGGFYPSRLFPWVPTCKEGH